MTSSVRAREVAAHNREKLLDMIYRYQTSALEDAAKDPLKEYILSRTGNTSAVDKLAQLLALQGVEVRRASAAFNVEGKEYPAGSYAISLAQPERRLARDVLDPQVSMDAAFLKGEEERRKQRQRSEVYDVTAWSLPLQFNVPIAGAHAAVEGSFSAVKLGDTPGGKVSGRATVAYLVAWGTTAAAKLLVAALHENLRVLSADKKFTQAGRVYPPGTLILMVKENPANLHETLDRLAATSGADVTATDSSWMDDGPDFGSSRVAYLRRPAILMAWDRPTNGTSAGETRWVLERQFGYPVTVIRTQQIGGADLSKFQVIILPEGNGYADVLGANGTRRLHEWVQAGGTLIGMGSAISYMAGNDMLAVQQENALASDSGAPAGGGRGGRGAAAAAPAETAGGRAGAASGNIERVAGHAYGSEAELEKAEQPSTQAPWPARGFLAKAKTDPEQWICDGVPENVYALVSGSAIYTPIKVDRGANAVVFAGADSVMASGYSWDEFRRQLAYKPFVLVQRDGRGNEIGFTADPNYRGYMDGLNLLFLNAVFRGPGHTGGGRGEGAGRRRWFRACYAVVPPKGETSTA